MYIKGDFSQSYYAACKLKAEYARKTNGKNNVKNDSYQLLFNNCGQVVMGLISLGKLNDGTTVEDYIRRNDVDLILSTPIPNTAMNVMQRDRVILKL